MFYFFKKETEKLKKCQTILITVIQFSLEIYSLSKQILISNLFLDYKC